MNIKLPTPGEMPARLFDLMVKRFQAELVEGFTSVDAALNSWILDEHEGANFLRATFNFDYDVNVEGEYLEQVMAQMAATVRAAGWFAQVDKGSLEISAIDFAELGDRDEDDEDDSDDEEESDDDNDEGRNLDHDDDSERDPIDPDLIAVAENGDLHAHHVDEHDGNPDVDEEPDGDSVSLPDDSERELEFEDDDDDADDSLLPDDLDDDDESDDPISTTLNSFQRLLQNSGLRFEQIEETDDDTLEIEMGVAGSVTEISVKVEPDANASDPDACILWLTVITSDEPSQKFVSVHSLIAYLQEVYGDANKS